MFSVFLGTIYYQLHSTSGWRWIFVEPLPVVDAVFVLLVFSFLLGPALLVFCRPVWAYSPRLARSFDVGLVILGLLFVLSGWYKPNLGSVVVGGLVGLLLCYIGLDSLLTGKSSLEWYLRSFGLPSLVRLGNETAVWLAWLNARLPSPEQQRALQQALNKAYPRSRTRTFISLILVSIGSWLVLTFLSAIIQWIVQTWLNQLFKVVPH